MSRGFVSVNSRLPISAHPVMQRPLRAQRLSHAESFARRASRVSINLDTELAQYGLLKGLYLEARQPAWMCERYVEGRLNFGRPSGHDEDAVGQLNCLLDVVGNKYNSV